MPKPLLAVDNDGKDEIRPIAEVREAHDAEHHPVLRYDPSDADARLDIALDESFPTSDAPGHAPPGRSEPAPSSGYDESAETSILRTRRRKAVARSAAFIGLPIAFAGSVIAVAGLWLFSGNNREP